MKSVQLTHFALLRDQRGLSSETHETSTETVGELYDELAALYCFTLPRNFVKAALNSEFVPMDTPFESGDEIVFIPPVAGG